MGKPKQNRELTFCVFCFLPFLTKKFRTSSALIYFKSFLKFNAHTLPHELSCYSTGQQNLFLNVHVPRVIRAS